MNVVPPPGVGYPADEKLLMTNTSHASKDSKHQKPIRIVLPREVCTDPMITAEDHAREIQKALKTLRGGSDSTSQTPRAEEEG